MPNFETHVIIGHTGGDVTLKYTDNGTAWATFSVAVNNPRRKDDPPTWYRIHAWRQTAEFVNTYVKKGAAVLVAGDALKLSEWTAQDGTQRVSIEMTAQRVELLGARGDAAESDAPREDTQLPF